VKPSYLVASGLTLAAAVWMASPYVLPAAEEQPQVASATTEAKLPLVRVRQSVAQPHVETLVLTGHTEFSRQTLIRAETAGRVIAVEATEGAVLHEGDVIARLAMDDREARMQESRALVAQRRVEFDAAAKLSAQGYQSENRRAEARAALDSALALLRRVELDIERTVLRAPFDGVLQDRVAEIGDYVQSGDPVAQIIDLDPLIAVAQVSERELPDLRANQEGELRMATGETVVGRIGYISSVGAEGTRTFRIELEIANPDNHLPAGLTTELRLPVKTVQAHLLSPSVLTLDDSGSIGIKAVDDAGVVGFHPVQIIADGAQGVWVTGLPDSVSIVIVGQEFVLPGQKVVAVPEAQAGTGGAS